MPQPSLRIDIDRLMARIDALAGVGSIEGGGVCRLALTEEDKTGRDLVVSLMRHLGLDVSIDRIGNVVGVRPGMEDGAPVMTGSHLDTVRTGGRYDGALGVLAGLEVVATLNDAGIDTRRSLAVAFFTNEEGARFAPDMMGSMVHQGHLPLEQALETTGLDQTTVREDLAKIGYLGHAPCGSVRAHSFVELHVEQGPVLERDDITIGAVEGVQGISWTEISIIGESNHAGTTPMSARKDAGYAAVCIARFARRLAEQMEGNQVATVGRLQLSPDVINVIPGRASLTIDLRNTDAGLLRRAEQRLHSYVRRIGKREDVYVAHRSLARYDPVVFAPSVIAMVERQATALGLSVRRLPSGAGHDAQAFAPNCPTGMIFVPSVGGVSHNVKEHTAPRDIEAGANVLLNVLLELAG
jgi:N-carbamoyl-L-amino-acid hydrolase